jgi:predicted transcriptional regulator
MSVRRSKLEMYTDILKVLAQQGPLQLPCIKDQANFRGNLLKQQLDFLIKQGLIEQKVLNKNVVYAKTNRGINLAKFFGQKDKNFAVEEKGASAVGAASLFC